MSEFLTRYPKKMKFLKGLQESIKSEELQFDHLSLLVKIKKDEIIRKLILEGFSKKLKKPWEIHVRLLDMQQGLIAIQGEVEISRRYIQHIRSVRSPVIYEIESILKKHRIEYKIWNDKVRDYITNIIENHHIILNSPKLPAMPWLLMIIFGSMIGSLHGLKLFGIF